MRLRTVVGLVLLACAVMPAEARYRYGRSFGSGDEQGWFVLLEAISSNPRNADPVVATSEIQQTFGGGTNRVSPIVPVWDDDVAGRFGVGYQWPNGNSLQLTSWSFETDTIGTGDGLPAGETLHFAVGPPIFDGSDFVGDNASPGHFDITTEIQASTIDLDWARSQELGDSFTMKWSVGLRFAEFEETQEGIYDEARSASASFGQLRYSAAKINEAEMFGARFAVAGRYRIGNAFSLNARLGVSFLDGELEASSGLTPIGTANAATVPSSRITITDDGRSGTIRELELGATWHLSSDRVGLSVGWEQSRWEDVPADLVRSFAGQSAPLRQRDSVTFSGIKAGVRLRF